MFVAGRVVCFDTLTSWKLIDFERNLVGYYSVAIFGTNFYSLFFTNIPDITVSEQAMFLYQYKRYVIIAFVRYIHHCVAPSSQPTRNLQMVPTLLYSGYQFQYGFIKKFHFISCLINTLLWNHIRLKPLSFQYIATSPFNILKHLWDRSKKEIEQKIWFIDRRNNLFLTFLSIVDIDSGKNLIC